MKLQEERKRAKFSQSQLAEKAGIEISTLKKYERGARVIDNANLKILLALAITLDCRLEDIVEDEDIVEMLRRVRWI
ncbi:MAG: helix-turn-helix transcriptional regulator [Phascolarctobacterium sp.]|nr:helix-turn-helix transcriptional regulator [Phascolarctobacterium sp.]